jgi:hypothetical protein
MAASRWRNSGDAALNSSRTEAPPLSSGTVTRPRESTWKCAWISGSAGPSESGDGTSERPEETLRGSW